MQKNAPSLPRIAAMVIFALSCFGLLLFLWLSFGGAMQDGGTLSNRQVEHTVELDEILRIFRPNIQAAFRQWVAESAQTIRAPAGQDLNDALGNLGTFAQSGSGVLSVLNAQHAALHDVIKNTGVVFAALNRRYGELHDLVLNS